MAQFRTVVGLIGALLTASVPPPHAAAAPEDVGFDSERLAAVILAAKASGQPIHSLTVVRAGETVVDVSFYPYDSSAPHDVASVTKSVMTSLVAIAAADGLLDLDDPMVSFFPESIGGVDARKDRITVRHLMENTSGLACVGSPEELTLSQMEASPDFVEFALGLPMAAEPGTKFDYCSPGMHLLSAILQRATGLTALQFANERLFGPLGIRDASWDSDPQGVTRGWGDLHLRAGDMVKLGRLWMNHGVWEDRQLIPSDWLEDATTSAIPSDRYEDYGYGFWVGTVDEPIPYFFASG